MNPAIPRHWRTARDQHYESPHFATASTMLKPQNIKTEIVGHHSSVVFQPGVRHYIFEGQKNRDRFINLYRQWEAKPCGDPFK